MKYIFPCLFIFLISSESICQVEQNTKELDEFYNHQIELRHDNDFLIFTDRYYTTGSFIEYRALSPKSAQSEDKKNQLFIGLEHLYYTPSNILSNNTDDFDRPYAGYLGVKAGSFMARKSQAFEFTFALGVTGRISGAEGFQKMFHSTGPSIIPPWLAQIKNDVHINFYGGYFKEWELLPKPFAVYASIEPKVAIGTNNLYLDQGFKFFFGKRNPLLQSMAYNQLGETKNEFFFSVNFAFRYVFHNALIEGYPIGDPGEFVVKANDEIFLYGLTGYYRTKRNDFKLGYQYVSKETIKSDWHIYFTISLARRF